MRIYRTICDYLLLTLKIKDMSKLSVSIPENLLDTINQRIESGDYSSISDYIRDLIRRDADRRAEGGAGGNRAGQGMTSSEANAPAPVEGAPSEVLPLPYSRP
jgi:antitoxin ParD1/3/4